MDKNKFSKNAGYKSVNSSTRSMESRPSSPFEQPRATIFAKQSTAPRLIHYQRRALVNCNCPTR